MCHFDIGLTHCYKTSVFYIHCYIVVSFFTELADRIAGKGV